MHFTHQIVTLVFNYDFWEQKLIQDPNDWASKNSNDGFNLDTHKTAIKLRDEFSMSPSQKDISANIFEKRLQIIWGPPVRLMIFMVFGLHAWKSINNLHRVLAKLNS